MKRFIFSLMLLIWMSVSMMAVESKEKETGFDLFKKSAARLDVKVELPKGYYEEPMMLMSLESNPYNASRMGLFDINDMKYDAAVRSKDKNVMFFYPSIFDGMFKCDIFIERDIQNYFGDAEMNVTNYIQVLPREKSLKLCNADYVALYKTKSIKPYFGQYQYF